MATHWGFEHTLDTFQMILNVIGVVVSLLSFHAAVRTMVAVVRANVWNGRRIIAIEHLWSEGTRLFSQTLLLGISLLGVMTPMGELPTPVAHVILISKTLLLVVSFSLTIGSISKYLLRLQYEANHE